MVILGVWFALYITSWATKMIRPHSFWARFRSVLTRGVIFTVVAGLISSVGYYVMPPVVAVASFIAWRHLRRDQKVYNWADR